MATNHSAAKPGTEVIKRLLLALIENPRYGPSMI